MKKFTKKSEKDLIKFVKESKAKLRSLRFKASSASLQDAKSLRETKKDIARALTALKEKALNK